MGWKGFKSISNAFKDVWGDTGDKLLPESVKTQGRALENVFKNPTDLDAWGDYGTAAYRTFTDPINRTLDNVTRSLKGTLPDQWEGSWMTAYPDLYRPPTSEDIERPVEAFAKDIDRMNTTVPSGRGALGQATGIDLRSYAVPIETAVLSAFNPLAGAAFATAYNAGKMQEQQKGMNWGAVGKDALVNFGTAAASMAASKALTASKAAQASNAAANATQTAANSGSLAQNLASGVGQATGVGTGAGLGAAVPQGFNIATTGSAIPAASSLAKFKATQKAANPENYSVTSETSLPKTSSSGLALQGAGDTAYNATLQGAPKVVNQALTATLAPQQNTALSGFDTNAGSYGADTYTPSSAEVFNAFGGDFVNNKDMITKEDFQKMLDALKTNTGMQTNMTRDVMLPAGQTEPEPNTPYYSRLGDIGKSYTQGAIDLNNQVALENYSRYNTNLYNKLSEANPGMLTEDMYTGWLKDPSTAPANLQQYFVSTPQLIGF